MFEKITKTLSGLAFIKYINSLIDYVNTSDIDATRIKGQLDISNIPPAGLDNVIKVDTVTDMLALTVDDVQNGDTVMIIGVTPPVQYQVVDDTKLGTMDAFQEYAAGTATKALADINGNNIHTTYGKLAGNNTWTGNNYWNGSAIFNANLNIRGSATTPGDTSVYLWLGLKPEGSEQAPCIARNKTGELIMHAADYRHCFLKSGIQTSFASVYNSDGTVEFSSLNSIPWGKYTKANGLELTVHKTPTVNNDVPNKKYVDDSIANGDVNSAKYLNITNFIPSNSDFNDYKTPGEYQVQSNTEANTIANLPTSYNDATPRGGVLSVLIGFNAPRTSLVQIYRTYGSSYVASRTYQRCLYHENSSWTAWREIACTDEVGLLNQANTYTALNIFRANIGVSNGTAAGSSGTVSFGVSPTGETVQARIGTDNLGGLFYHASTNQPHVFRVGTNNNVFVIRADNTKVAFSSNNNFFATVTHDGVAKWLGNANTATKLETARTINGVPFDGTQNITIEAGQGTFLPLTGGTVTGPIYLPSTTPTTDTQAVTKKYVDDSVAGAGGGDVTAAGNNAFTGLNTFANETTFGNELNVWDSLTSQSSTGQINIGRVSGANGAYITGESGGGLALHTKKGQPLELLDGVDGNLAVLTTSQATIYPNIVQIGSATLLESVGIRKATIGDYPLQILDGNMIAAQFNGNSHKAAFEASEVMINSSEISTNFAIKNASQNILDCNGTAMHLRTGNSSIGLELGSGTSGWALQCPADATDVRVARRLYVGSQGGVGNGVISADNTENCLYFCGTAENTYYSTPNTGNTISYQAAANVYLINTSINDAASLTMNFSNMSFHATVGSTPYMCKTLTFWFATGATAPTVTWQFPSGAAVYYPKGVAPSLTANASNIINVVAIVDDTDSFSIQVCDVVALPYSG